MIRFAGHVIEIKKLFPKVKLKLYLEPQYSKDKNYKPTFLVNSTR